MRAHHYSKRLAIGLGVLLLLSPFQLIAAPVDVRPPEPQPQPPPRTLLHRTLWYLPNRLLDLADIARLRVRIGPGLAVRAHATHWVTFFSGEYHAAYAGLPGPRQAPGWPIPAGLEQEKGLCLFGVDATDTLPHEPVYSKSEFVLGAHVLAAGAEAGVDPVEIVDFLLGFVLIDIRKDDH
ncbi:MAG: hypothetical protein R6X19_09775 [Kiritimatiellia bacterium]